MLSVIIPTYNSAETLLESYKSVLKSGVKDQEIIFVDDGSTDETHQIISRIKSTNSNVIFLKNPLNLGGGATRNKGVEQAKNPFIFILDSDDILLPGALGEAVEDLKLTQADGVATSQSVFFSDAVAKPINIIKYKSGYSTFENLVSHTPNPVIGNLLFTKQAFLDVGGYPSHHSFDTQGFGFRLLQNNKKIYVGRTFIYYQRLPFKPSYYAREARAGNVNRNWFYIFNECLYKFSPKVRNLILEFPYSDPLLLAKGHNLFNVLADQASDIGFYCKDSMGLDEDEAYIKYANTGDCTMNAWCASYEIKNGHYEAAFDRLKQDEYCSHRIRLMYPMLAKIFGNNFSLCDIEDLSYFFSKEKSRSWRFNFLRQKFINRLKISRYMG
ncbi:glycosyltransferase family 2 protein [Polynucleobacter sp. AP-Capit-er-40B-B4]|uniref:glycosyltransferase family 2 protein n=1 Tax=Polynucleobacter sp. AP-Capit-er-40B-B4 TaxID=2576927 RepID=UPI001C0C4C64|nr:glycosyltransferase family 2 protein [Polynucleobacter sp. AP-Capit-er-40B-B4]MBU3580985.1 glycosyltransferase family 2 protein [Polynucleobacter sp. AP-Capit-er-40B-B4]